MILRNEIIKVWIKKGPLVDVPNCAELTSSKRHVAIWLGYGAVLKEELFIQFAGLISRGRLFFDQSRQILVANQFSLGIRYFGFARTGLILQLLNNHIERNK